jgi:predicted GH43/DUF377 family glycosyl hydrolase
MLQNTALIVLLLFLLVFANCQQPNTKQAGMDFSSRIQPADNEYIFEMKDYYIWGSSVVKENDTYHMFVSRWPKKYTFYCWLTHSDIIHAVSDKPEGPFEFKEELTVLKQQKWAEKMVCNPMVYHIGDKYYLYYIGLHWAGYDGVKAAQGNRRSKARQAIRFQQRIGLASAPSPNGPWTPYPDNPILSPRKDHWDSTFVTNPVVYFSPENELLMMYKSTTGTSAPLQLGLTTAPKPEGPYRRIGKQPLFDYNVEESFVWREYDRYWMLSKDMSGKIAGERDVGLLLTSTDGIDWDLAENPVAYELNIKWKDGTIEDVPRVERPFIYIENNRPVCLYNAIGEENLTHSYNLARLLNNGAN